MKNSFTGKNGFIWWFGTVESNGDPLGVGRCRVRISGWHSENINELQTDQLPWAYCLSSIDSYSKGSFGKSSNGLLPGARVFGFFIDAEKAEVPVILAAVSGVTENEIKRNIEYGSLPWYSNVYNTIFGNNPQEGDCPPGYEENSQSISIDKTVDQRNIQINASEWVLPFSGFVSSDYSEARGNGSHNGVDICPALFFKQNNSGAKHLNGRLRGPAGLPVYASCSGVVSYVWTADKGQGGVKTNYDKTGTGSRSYGNAIAINHQTSTGNFTTIYAHLGVSQDAGNDKAGSGISVSVGDSVSKGQKIGTVGRSHVWQSPTHLHFEIRKGAELPKFNNHINPGRVFPQLRNKHWSFLSMMNNYNNYSNVDILNKDTMPVVALKGPE